MTAFALFSVGFALGVFITRRVMKANDEIEAHIQSIWD